MRYRVCGVSSSILDRSCYWDYAPYWAYRYYPQYWNNSTNIVDSQLQNADQSIVNTGMMTGNTQTQTLTQIGKFQPLK